MKILKFARFQQELVRGNRALMTIKFLDEDSTLYSRAPRWTDLEAAFLRALNVEGFNKPESDWLNRFANTVKDVSEGVSQPIQEARKLYGVLYEVKDGQLVIYWHQEIEYEENLIPGFAITYDFLDEWLRRRVEVLIINGIAVRLKCTEGPYSGEEYPPKLTYEPDADRDLPF